MNGHSKREESRNSLIWAILRFPHSQYPKTMEFSKKCLKLAYFLHKMSRTLFCWCFFSSKLISLVQGSIFAQQNIGFAKELTIFRFFRRYFGHFKSKFVTIHILPVRESQNCPNYVVSTFFPLSMAIHNFLKGNWLFIDTFLI